MDEPEVPAAALRAAHGAGMLAMIAALVAVCGFGLQAFLGHLGAASAQSGEPPSRPDPVAALTPSPDPGYRPPPTDTSPGPDQQAAFLETIRLSGTGGWSSRLDILTYGVRACRLLADGRQPPDVVSTLVAGGESAEQAQAVVSAAPLTLCPA